MLGVGYAPTKGEIDSTGGDMTLALRSAFEEVQRYYLFIQRSVANGYLASVGYTPDQVTFLNSCAADLYQLWLVAQAKATVAVANDIFYHANELAGVK